MKNIILLISGGLDSVTLAHYIKKKIKPKNFIFLYFDFNQKPLKNELTCIKKIAKRLNAKLKIINLKFLEEFDIKTKIKTKESDLKNIKKLDKQVDKWFLPCRNSIFLISALAYAENLYFKTKKVYDIYIGLICEGKVPMKDTTKEFIKEMNNLVPLITKYGEYKIIAPFIGYDKDQVVALGKKLKVPFGYTYSCYLGSDNLIHCGTCLACMLRKKAFYWSGLKDLSKYSFR